MKEKQRLKTVCDIFMALVVTLLCAFLTGYFYDCYYDLNDDVLIKDILAGTYTGQPEGRNIQMLYPIGLLISLFYKMFPRRPWYGIFLYGCHLLCFYLIARRVLSYTLRYVKKIILLVFQAILFAGLLLWEFVYVQYSVTCALLVATGIFLFYTTDEAQSAKKFIRGNWISAFLMILGFYVRTEMMLLLCPLAAAAVIAKWAGGAKRTKTSLFSKENLLRYPLPFAVVILGMGIGLFVNAIAYRGSDWREFNRFFDYRTELYDFQEHAPDYGKNSEFYESINLNEAEVALLENYNYSVDADMDSAKLGKIVKYNREKLNVGYFRYNVYDGLKEYAYRVVHAQDGKWIYAVISLYILIFFTGMMHWDYSVPWKLLLLAVMRSVSWMYLIMRGRVPERITTALYLCETMILLAMLLQQFREVYSTYRIVEKERFIPRYRRLWPLCVILILTAIVMVPAYQNAAKVRQEQERREKVNRDWTGMREYFARHQDNFYITDVYSTVSYSEKMFENVDNGYRNYDICGGWAAGSPIYAQKLAKRGITDIETDLLQKNHFFFVTKSERSAEWLLDYYWSKDTKIRLYKEASLETPGGEQFTVYKICAAYESSQIVPENGRSVYFKTVTE